MIDSKFLVEESDGRSMGRLKDTIVPDILRVSGVSFESGSSVLPLDICLARRSVESTFGRGCSDTGACDSGSLTGRDGSASFESYSVL